MGPVPIIQDKSHVQSVITPKVEYFEEDSSFHNPIYTYGQKNTDGIIEKIKKGNVWKTFKEILSPKATYNPETHFSNFIARVKGHGEDVKVEKSEYHNAESEIEEVSIWEKVKSAFSQNQPLYTEHHYLGPLPIINENDLESSPISNPSIVHTSEGTSDKEYIELYKDAANEIFHSIKNAAQKLVPIDIKDTVKEVLSPMETSDPETHFENLINDPLIQDVVQEVSESQDTFLTRVSEITRADLVNTGVEFWKIMYQLLFVLVAFIILTPFGIDIMTEGGLL